MREVRQATAVGIGDPLRIELHGELDPAVPAVAERQDLVGASARRTRTLVDAGHATRQRR